jgi:putative lipoic acid-binding regulatory protein
MTEIATTAAGAPPSAEALEAVHTFPGPYTIKAFGTNANAFADAVEQVVRACVPNGTIDVSRRPSSGGKFLCATVTFTAQHAQQVQSVYVELQTIDGLRMLL